MQINATSMFWSAFISRMHSVSPEIEALAPSVST
jgi:hypothetical protein